MILVYVINGNIIKAKSEIIPRVGEYVDFDNIDYKVSGIRYKMNHSSLTDIEIVYNMSNNVYIYLEEAKE